MENLTPRTREEEFLKGAAEGGTDLIPLPDVRREAFLKRLSDPTYPRPEGTKTREEWFLDQAAKGGGGSITVEELDVTENGTYTAPAMTAYNPVNVNVPLPENALLLKDIPSTPTAIATFSDGAEMVMPSLKVAIEPQQEGSGDPSPTNIRPISGWDEVDVTVADDVETPTVSNVYTIDLDGTRYGGKVDLVSGVMTDIIKAFEVDDASDIEMLTSHIFRINKSKYPDGKFNGDSIEGLLCEKFKPQISDMPNNICYSTSNGLIIRTIDAYSNTSEFFNAIGSFKFTYPLATPLTIQLTPTAVKSLEGDNNLFADSGEILEGEYLGGVS